MHDLLKQLLGNQFDGALCMLRQCIAGCPGEQWEAKVANGTFRWVAYHTLFFVDYYLAPGEKAFQLRELHAIGGTELSDEPAPGLSQAQTLEYLGLCREKAHQALAAETVDSLQGQCGFGRSFSRAELHVYNIRHIQHHAGQLSAFLRRVAPGQFAHRDLPWIGSGWRGPA